MRKDYTDITVVLDRSGSMAGCWNDTLGGLNHFIEEQQKVKGKARLTLAIFDNEYNVVFDAVPISEVPKLTNEHASPRNATALYDAVCQTIDNAGARFAKMPEKERPNSVIFVVVTDGMNNASTRFNSQDTKQRVTHQESVYNWNFVYLGADFNAKENCKTMGFADADSQSYNKAGTWEAYNQLTSNVRSHRMSGEQKASVPLTANVLEASQDGANKKQQNVAIRG